MEATLTQFISEDLLDGRMTVGRDDSLLADGMVDSLGMLRLVTHIETLLGTRIPHEDLVIENFRTVGDIVAYLERSHGGRTAPNTENGA